MLKRTTPLLQGQGVGTSAPESAVTRVEHEASVPSPPGFAPPRLESGEGNAAAAISNCAASPVTAASHSVVIPPPPGAASLTHASFLDRSDQHSTRETGSSDRDFVPDSPTQPSPGAEAHPLTFPANSPVDVPPNAVPVSRYHNFYDGSRYLPPGTTKRALGRLRIIWCCVVTQESWHAFFIAGPILFFVFLFVTFVVPPGEWFSYVFTFVFTLGSLACMTMSVTMDPGVIPPAPQSEQPRGATKILFNDKMVECRVCTTCHILRPPRSSHCRFCDVCVEEYDHHCGILGSCVAKRTFRFFGGFFIITSVLAVYVLIRSYMIIMSTDFTKGNEDMHLLLVAASSVLCIVAALIGGCMVVPCAGRYILLSATNVTLKETLRREQEEEQQQVRSEQIPGCVPAAEMNTGNCWSNLWHRMFSPIGRSRIPFDYYI